MQVHEGEQRLKAHARVQLTVSIDLKDTWGNECTINQIQKQAKDGAISSMWKWVEETGVTIVGEPKVTIVIIENE
jgi:hypothetical protein